MGTKTQSGFTIIEVMLFLGLSAALLVGILAATGTAISNARFTDTVKGFESFMQRQYDEVVNGVNPRTAAQSCSGAVPVSPGADSCLLLGKLIVFTADSNVVNVSYVVGSGSLTGGTNLTTSAALTQLTLRTTAGAPEVFELPWGAQFRKANRDSAPRPVNAVAYLRSPVSSQIETYIFPVTNVASASRNLELTFNIPGRLTAASNQTASICFAGADGTANQYQGVLSIARGQGASTISARQVTAAEWGASC